MIAIRCYYVSNKHETYIHRHQQCRFPFFFSFLCVFFPSTVRMRQGKEEKKYVVTTAATSALAKYLSSNHHHYYSSINQQSGRSYFPSSSSASYYYSRNTLLNQCIYIYICRSFLVLLFFISAANYPHLPRALFFSNSIHASIILYSQMRSYNTSVLYMKKNLLFA